MQFEQKTNSSSSVEKYEKEKNIFFENMYQKILSSSGNFLEYDAPYSKVEFLQYLTKNKNLLVHGSNYDLDELKPREANCTSKKFGNLNAVYATADAVLTIFYSIKDKEKFHGAAASGYSEKVHSDGTIKKSYEFEVEQKMFDSSPWSSGIIYILAKDSFEQGTGDDGVLIDEWVSRKAVKPIAKLRVNPEDFPFLKEIKPI